MYGVRVLFSSRSIRSVRYHSGNTKKLLEFLANMPKANSARIAEAQRQRQNISKKSEKYGPSSVYLQVLGSGARGAPNTLYLFTDQKRYLFNCGECTQRLAHEHKVKLSKLDHIFITNKTWKNIGGLPGLSLTLQDVGVPNITLHGPDGLDELYQATKRFVIMKDMNVTMAKCSPAEDFEDNVMTVKYVLLGPLDNILTDKDLMPVAKKAKLDDNTDKEFEEFIHDDTDYYRPEIRNMEAKNKTKDKEKPKSKTPVGAEAIKKKTEKVLQELQKQTNPSVAYICTLKKRLGTLDLAKCVERGVKPGPMLGQLKSGQDVVLPDGTLVLSKDVKTPDDPGPVFIVLDIPDISYLKESEFSAHFDTPTNPPENVPTLVVHFTPPHVFHQPQYRAFMAMFGTVTQHLVLNNQNSCLGSEAVHRTQHKLHLLDPDIFPLLRDASVPAVWTAHPPVPKANSPVRLKGLEELKNKIALAQFQNIISLEGSCKGDGVAENETESAPSLELVTGRTLTMFHLRPKREVDRSLEPKLHIQEYIQESMDMDGFAGSLEQFRRLVDSIRYAKSDSQKEYPKVVFLGTGSCIPSKTRNTSAIVLQMDESRSMLMDCGEGTFGQLVRFYGPKKVNTFLRSLKAIYISHLHADHHIGLIGVLQARREAFEEIDQERRPLYLLAPGQIVTWLTLYDQQFEKIRSEFTLIPNQILLPDTQNQSEVVTPAVLADIGIQEVQTCLVAHCPNAFGVAIDVDGQNKITYSGDTLPCEELVKIGENSTLLIHEATMEDELADEARMKMHSTTSQAIEIGRQMGARFTVLTHFSQRYARLPRLNAHILNDNNSVGIAFDNMQITMSDLELLPHMYAPLQLMFAEHCVEMELKAANRARQKGRRSSSPHLLPTVNTGDDRNFRRSRWGSAGCRSTSSAPVPQANYMETNSSRLRQELKGMAITGIVRKPCSRSNSVSPPKSPRRSSSHQHSGSTTSKKRQDLSPKKSPEVTTSRQHSSVTTPNKRQDLSPVKTLEVPVTRDTVSDMSNLTNGDTPQKVDQTKSTNTPSSLLEASRSKTINKIQSYRPPTGDEVLNVMAQKTKVKPAEYVACSPCERNGYGKPLVTPLNKKLINRRDVPAPPYTDSNCDRGQYRMRTKSQSRASRKAENRESTPAATVTPHVLKKQTLPTKVSVSGNKLRASNACPIGLKDHQPASRGTVSARQIRPLSAADKPRSPAPNRTPPRSAKSMDTKMRVTGAKSIHSEYQREMKVMNMESNYLSLPTGSRVNTSTARKTMSPDPTRRNQSIKSLPGNNLNPFNYDTPINSPKPSLSREYPGTPTRHSTIRVTAVSTSRQRMSQEGTVKSSSKPNSAKHSTKSFKPQLEDIKSSYLLLNTTNRRANQAAPDNAASNPQDKPKQFNEELRRQQLMEARMKFQSRRFINDSRYDKIEGLNWISWK